MRVTTLAGLLLLCSSFAQAHRPHQDRTVGLGRLQPVFAWRQLTYNINDTDEAGSSFIQYNNVPVGVERVGNTLFVTVPRRGLGVVSTLNYIDLDADSSTLSPGLRPYPSLPESRNLTSVYRTRADECGRLWMVDTGMLEIPNNRQQVQPPAIVIYDLRTNTQILRYPLKSSDLASERTPAGLTSITVDVSRGDCGGAHAYLPDLATYGLVVFSLRARDSWRLTHSYFYFNPVASNLRIMNGKRVQLRDGIFSVALSPPAADGCRAALFHALASTHEFCVSTCVLNNRTASNDSDFWTHFSVVGDRGVDSQSNIHGYHAGSNVVLFNDIARDAISCWNAGSRLSPASIAILAQDSTRLNYPSDLHVTGDEVWVMANRLLTYAFSTLNTSEYNFFIYKANVQDLISGTVCAERNFAGGMRPRTKEYYVQQPIVQHHNVQQRNVQQPKVQQRNVQQPNLQQRNMQQHNVQQPKVQQPNVQQPNLQQPSKPWEQASYLIYPPYVAYQGHM